MPEEIRRRIYEEAGTDFSGTICKGATFDDLDATAIENFRASWIEKSGKKQLSALSKEQLLFDCGAITDEGLTYAALILFGKNTELVSSRVMNAFGNLLICGTIDSIIRKVFSYLIFLHLMCVL